MKLPGLGHRARIYRRAGALHIYSFSLLSPSPRGPLFLFPPPASALLVLFRRVLDQRLWLKSEGSSLLASALSENRRTQARKSSQLTSPQNKSQALPRKGTAGFGSNLQLSVIN